jgi:hypothetical protein
MPGGERRAQGELNATKSSAPPCAPQVIELADRRRARQAERRQELPYLYAIGRSQDAPERIRLLLLLAIAELRE